MSHIIEVELEVKRLERLLEIFLHAIIFFDGDEAIS